LVSCDIEFDAAEIPADGGEEGAEAKLRRADGFVEDGADFGFDAPAVLGSAQAEGFVGCFGEVADVE